MFPKIGVWYYGLIDFFEHLLRKKDVKTQDCVENTLICEGKFEGRLVEKPIAVSHNEGNFFSNLLILLVDHE